MKCRTAWISGIAVCILVISACSFSCKLTRDIEHRILGRNSYRIIQFGDTTTSQPGYVNVFFQVDTTEGKPVNDLTTSYFIITDGGMPNSPSESAPRIKKHDELPYELKTVLMLDNTLSLGEHIHDVQEAARTLVLQADAINETDRNGSTGNQKIAVWSFEDEPIRRQDFTNDVAVLLDAINAIELGTNSTNLYGAVDVGLDQWYDTYDVNKIVQGFLIVLTDGEDTRRARELAEIVERIEHEGKRVFTVGVGEEAFVPENIEALELLGSAGSYTFRNFSDLVRHFELIQDYLHRFANSFYNLYYLTPRVDTGMNTLEIQIERNTNNDDETNRIETAYNSDGLYAVSRGIYLDDTRYNRETRGITELILDLEEPKEIRVNIYLGRYGGVPHIPEISLSDDSNGSIHCIYTPYSSLSVHRTERNLPQFGGILTITNIDAPAGDEFVVRLTDSANKADRELIIKIHD